MFRARICICPVLDREQALMPNAQNCRCIHIGTMTSGHIGMGMFARSDFELKLTQQSGALRSQNGINNVKTPKSPSFQGPSAGHVLSHVHIS
jgi:hypothetical protein